MSFKKTRIIHGSNGFTLIEVLISITILATLGLLAAQTIKQAINQKKVIQEIVSETSRLHDSVKIIERDLNLAYHHRDWEKELIDLAKSKKPKTNNLPNQNQAAQPTVPVFDANGQVIGFNDPAEAQVEAPRVDPTTQFIGKENEMHFVTMNTGRLLKDAPQADFIEVGYLVKDCRSFDGKSESKCLYRRLSPWVDNDVTKGGDEYVLVEHITEFSLRYMGRGKQDWVKDWRTDAGGDGITKDRFPNMVELSITYQKKIEKTEGKKHSMQLVIPIHFPNNKEDGESGSGTSTQTPAQAPAQVVPSGATPTPAPTPVPALPGQPAQ